MEESFELVAIPLPGNHAYLVIARSKSNLDLSSPDEETPFSSLPKKWKARKAEDETKKFIRIVENGSDDCLRLLETDTYKWTIEYDESLSGLKINSSLENANPNRWQVVVKKGQIESGQFQVVNHLGFASFVIEDSEGEPLLSVPLEIVSKKFDFDTEYRTLTEDIAEFCEQLLLNWEAPTSLSFSADSEKPYRLILEQFLFLRHFLNDETVGRLLEAISRNPHSELRVEREWKPVAAARSSDYLSNPSRMLRSWQRNGKNQHPAEVLDTRKRESYDTAPNRFIKYALSFFRQLCVDVVETIEASNHKAATVAMEATELVKQLDALVCRPFFREIGTMTRLPLDNQTLQKREGYREILQAWLLTQAAASLQWTGNEECYQGDSRDVATLYEYWIFIQLFGLLKELPGMKPYDEKSNDPESFISESKGQIKINLQSGKLSKTCFHWTAPSGDELNVDLYYERTFKSNEASVSTGSYSRQFRPDYTFAIYPASCKSEKVAKQKGKVSYLHFDAKYRANQIKELFGEQSENEDDEKEISEEKLTTKVTAEYKRGDLLKMHTYNDALRNTIGSYVLYPGTESEQRVQMNKFHEIAPGVGAMVMKPGNPSCLETLKAFLQDILAHQADAFSQFRYLTDTSYSTYCESPESVVNEFKEEETKYSIARKDAPCVILWLRKEDEEILKSHGFAYCHAIPKKKNTKLEFNLSIEVGSEFIPCGGSQGAPKMGLGWRAKIRSARFVSIEKLQDYIDSKGLSSQLKPKSAEHYLLFEFQEPTEFQKLDLSEVYRSDKSGSDYMAKTYPWSSILSQLPRKATYSTQS